MKIKRIMFGMVFLLLSFSVVAIVYHGTFGAFPITQFNDTTAKNLTFLYFNQTKSANLVLFSYYRYSDATFTARNYAGETRCYQETANVSTWCGGLSTGLYNLSGQPFNFEFVGDPNQAIDGDYNTFAGQTLEGNCVRIYINYTKPSSSNSAIWQVKDSVALINLSIPSSCFVLNPSVLNLKAQACYFVNDMNWSCWNGGWLPLRNVASAQIYEEAIFWNMSSNITNLTVRYNNNTIYSLESSASTSIDINISINSSDINNSIKCDLNFCTANLTFESIYGGILEISSLYLNYSINYNHTYSNETIEKSSQVQSIEIFTNESISANLSSEFFTFETVSNASSNNSFRRDFNVTLRSNWVNTTTQRYNNSFWWVLNLLGGSYSTTKNNQTVFKMYVDDCTNASTRNINFQVKKESDDSLLNSNLSAYFNLWYLDSTYVRNYSIAFNGTGNYTVCSSPDWANYTTNAQMEYSGGIFSKKLSYLANYMMTNVLKVITLYLTESTTQVKFTVTDATDNPVPNVYIKVLSYDIGTNSYKVTEIIKTDSDGVAYGQIILNTQFYKFILEYNGEVVQETLPSKITTTTKNFRISLQTDYFEAYNQAQYIQYLLTLDNNTKVFSCTVSDTSGSADNICLKVVKSSFNSETFINKTCVASSATTIIINASTVTTGTSTLKGTCYVENDGNTFVLDTVSANYDSTYKNYKKGGLFATFMFVTTVTMVGIWSPVVAIVLMVLAVFVMILAKMFVLSVGIIVSLVIIAAITIYRMNK